MMVRNLLLQLARARVSPVQIVVGLALVYSALSVTYSVVALSQSFEEFAPCRFAEFRI
jgi:hypothetical protein